MCDRHATRGLYPRMAPHPEYSRFTARNKDNLLSSLLHSSQYQPEKMTHSDEQILLDS